MFERQQIHDQIGKGADQLDPTLLPDADEAMVGRLGEAEAEVFEREYLQVVRPFAGARDLISRVLAGGKKVFLASSASRSQVEYYLNLLDVHGLVCATTSADDVAHTKPAPDISAIALEKVAPLRADEVLVVGDTPYDVEAAARCGISAVGVRSGCFSDTSLNDATVLAIYKDVDHLLAEYDHSALAS